jgi:Sulfotransferase family
MRYLADDLRCARLARTYHFAGSFRRIYHFHIRKTGGTSLNHLFLSLGGRAGAEVYAETCREPYRPVVVNDKVFLGWNQPLIERGHYYYAYSHMPYHRLTLPPQTFTFTCLRDPATRVISLYTMILGYRDEPAPDRRKQRQLLWLGNGFSDFLLNLPPEELLNQIFMFSRALDRSEAFDNIASCSHYILTEGFSAGIQGLADKLQLALEPIHIRRSPVRPELGSLELEQLREKLEPEYWLYEKLLA